MDAGPGPELSSGNGDALVAESAGEAIHLPRGVWRQGRNQANEPAIPVISYNTGRRQIVAGGI